MKGPRPKSPARQMAAGDPRKHGMRKLEERLAREVKPPAGLGRCPEHLTGKAREAWNGWVQDLEQMGHDKRPDARALEGACSAYALAVEADEWIRKEGAVVEETNSKGETRLRVNPAVPVSRNAWAQVRMFAEQFGFTPAARSRLSSEKAPAAADEDFAALLEAPRGKDKDFPQVH